MKHKSPKCPNPDCGAYNASTRMDGTRRCRTCGHVWKKRDDEEQQEEE